MCYDFTLVENEMKGDSPKTVRRSIALPSDLMEEVRSVAPPELRDNFNRLVTIALYDFAKRRKRANLEKAMAEMAQDPAMKKESAEISEEFLKSETDGL
jgi:cation transport regulator ChaB